MILVQSELDAPSSTAKADSFGAPVVGQFERLLSPSALCEENFMFVTR